MIMKALDHMTPQFDHLKQDSTETDINIMYER